MVNINTDNKGKTIGFIHVGDGVSPIIFVEQVGSVKELVFRDDGGEVYVLCGLEKYNLANFEIDKSKESLAYHILTSSVSGDAIALIYTEDGYIIMYNDCMAFQGVYFGPNNVKVNIEEYVAIDACVESDAVEYIEAYDI